MRRKLQLESLEERLCFAFGDVDPNFAQSGEYSVSYSELDRKYSSVVQSFNLATGFMVVADSQAGSGYFVTLAKLDNTGAADSSFGNGGVVQFIDPAVPKSFVAHAVQLTDGRMVLQSSTASDYLSFIALRADGSIDESFATSGFLRRGEVPLSDFEMIADRAGGFLTVESNPQSLKSQVRRYTGAGQLDTAFGQNGMITLSTRLTNSAMAIDNAGVITIVGYDTLASLKLKSYRFSASGVADATFGTGGIATGPSIMTLAKINLTQDGESFTLLSARTANGNQFYDVTKYFADSRLDNSFGTAGVASVSFTPMSAGVSNGVSIFVEDDGTYRVALSESVYSTNKTRLITFKLQADGKIDTNYGDAGRVEQLLSARYSISRFQRDGHGGLFWYSIGQQVPNANYISDGDTIRTNASGVLDMNWDGDGIKPLRFTPQSQTINWMQLDTLGQGRMRVLSGWPTFNSSQPNIGKAETLDADGNIITSSAFGRTISKQYTVTSPSADGGWYIAQFLNGGGNSRIEITKFFSTGGQDTNFGTSGVMSVATDNLWTIVMSSSRDGSVAIAGATLSDQTDPATSQGAAVIIRLNANGTPMQSFGTEGVKRIYSKTGNLADVLVDPNLGVVLVYDPNSEPGIVMQRYTDTGVLDTRFDTSGVLPYLNWAATEVDEMGRILLVANFFESFTPYQLFQLGADGALVTSFGAGGHIDLPITRQPDLASVAISARQGVITVASSHTRDATVVRLLAYDYAGKPLTELDGDGIRDYELTPDGEQVADLQFSDDGSLWLATMNREKFDLFGKVIKLEGSTSPTLHNWSVPLDVSLDGRVTAFDALIVISALNGIAPPANMKPDTNADTRLTALDALLIINRLNAQGGEGESGEDVGNPVTEICTSWVAHDVVMDTYGELEMSARRRKG